MITYASTQIYTILHILQKYMYILIYIYIYKLNTSLYLSHSFRPCAPFGRAGPPHRQPVRLITWQSWSARPIIISPRMAPSISQGAMPLKTEPKTRKSREPTARKNQPE